MQKEIETPNFSNTPGFAGHVGRVELLGENNSVCASIEFDSEKKFILFIFHMTVHYVLMNICFYPDYENCTGILLSVLTETTKNIKNAYMGTRLIGGFLSLYIDIYHLIWYNLYNKTHQRRLYYACAKG